MPPERYCAAAYEPSASRAVLSRSVLRAASSRRSSTDLAVAAAFSLAPLYCSVATSASRYSRSTSALTWAGVGAGSACADPGNAAAVAAPAKASVAAVRAAEPVYGRCLGFRCAATRAGVLPVDGPPGSTDGPARPRRGAANRGSGPPPGPRRGDRERRPGADRSCAGHLGRDAKPGTRERVVMTVIVLIWRCVATVRSEKLHQSQAIGASRGQVATKPHPAAEC